MTATIQNRHLSLGFLFCAMLQVLWPVMPDAFGAVTLTSLASFSSFGPQSLAQDTDGNFYGTIEDGGTYEGGSVFRTTTNGVLTTLVSFNGDNGFLPQAGLVQGTDGNFYGTTTQGGITGYGTVFRITANGALTTLASFNIANGYIPLARLVLGSDGNLYGTTFNGGIGSPGNGTVFKISINGALTSLYPFTGGRDGANPSAGLVQASDGYFYGTTTQGGSSGFGTVFKITTNGAFSTLLSFASINTSSRYSSLLQGTDGNFYGTTTYGLGTVFRMAPSGALTTLASFNGPSPSNPSGLLQATDGNFYGTTFEGGTFGLGSIFMMTTNGALSTLFSFSGTNGSLPFGLLHATDGSFYGTTFDGGTSSNGTVFRLSINLQPVVQTVELTNGNLNLTCSVVAGQRYQVQYTTNLLQNAWNNLGSVIIATNGTVSASESFGSGSQQFYRVARLP